MKILLLKFDDGSIEEFGVIEDDGDIRYWIDRRIEKSGKTAIEGWISSEKIDVKSFVIDYHERCEKYERESRERNEKAEYERLKKKYASQNGEG